MKTKAPSSQFKFPKKFTWGTTTAAPQIEGAAFEDGKCASIWDKFSRQKGAVLHGHNLDVACDHYHRFRSDFKLMKSLGIRNYSFSFSWCRLFPENNQTPNKKGVDFYRKLIECMIENGITPWGTMYHWDLPYYFQDQGGWLTRKMPEAFAHYSDFLVKTYGDLVNHWAILKEVSCFIGLSYGSESFQAPGLRLSNREVNQATHHALLAQGYGIESVRSYGGSKAKVGTSENIQVVVPTMENEECIHAAKELFQEYNSPIMGAFMRGQYDRYYERRIPKNERAKFLKNDFDLISQPIDFAGINIYTGVFAGVDEKGKPKAIPFSENYPRTNSPWLLLNPRALYWGPRLQQECYGTKAIYIMENGFGYNEPDEISSEYPDVHRQEFYRLYLEQAHRAIQDGVPIKGYFAWSFMDNFEWADGYTRRFGLVHTDYKTQKRTPKQSARWYSNVIQRNGLV